MLRWLRSIGWKLAWRPRNTYHRCSSVRSITSALSYAVALKVEPLTCQTTQHQKTHTHTHTHSVFTILFYIPFLRSFFTVLFYGQFLLSFFTVLFYGPFLQSFFTVLFYGPFLLYPCSNPCKIQVKPLQIPSETPAKSKRYPCSNPCKFQVKSLFLSKNKQNPLNSL